MKKASWGCCVLVFDSSGEPAGHPDFSDSFAPGCSGTEFEIGRTSCEDGLGAIVHGLRTWIASQVCIVLRVVVGEIWVSFISVRFQVR